jgi:hypothetical protein
MATYRQPTGGRFRVRVRDVTPATATLDAKCNKAHGSNGLGSRCKPRIEQRISQWNKALRSKRPRPEEVATPKPGKARQRREGNDHGDVAQLL